MNYTKLGATSIFFSSLLFTSSPVIAGWKATEWGMTPQEVESSTAGVAKIDAGETGDRLIDRRRVVGNVGTFDWMGKPARVLFYYEDNKLVWVSIRPTEGRSCSEVLTVLQAEYKEPSDVMRMQPEGRPDLETRIVDWDNDGSGNRVRFLSLSPSSCSIGLSPAEFNTVSKG